MNSIDLIKLAFKNFLRRKVRSFLTILGVIIGTCAIIVMLSLGIGMNESFMKNISRMGSLNIINVDPYYFPEGQGGMMVFSSRQAVIDDEKIRQISEIDGVEAVTPMLQANLKFVAGKYSAYVNIIGIEPKDMEKFDFKLEAGRLLTEADGADVVFGGQISRMFYNPRNRYSGFRIGMGPDDKPPVDVMTDKMVMTFDMSYGERTSPFAGVVQQGGNKPPKLYKVKGVGLLAQSQNEKDYSAYMNISYLKKIMKDSTKGMDAQEARMRGMNQQEGYQQAMVKVKNIKDVQAIQKKINELGLGARSLADILKEMQKTAGTMQAVLGGIGAISLLVAALGITNTMIMSIYERTREIGIMKVLGCLLRDIRKLFLLEAGFIGFIGGLTGMLLSLGASLVLNYFGAGFLGGGMRGPGEQNSISVIPLWLALSSVGFATFVGLVSGFYPARRAMKLSALEAIKTE